MEFPKWKYGPDKQAVMVNDVDEEKALGSGWANHPDAVKSEAPKKEAETKKKEV